MAKFEITFNCPDGDIEMYLEQVVFPQIKEGYTSGHTDSETNWDSKGLAELDL